MEEEEKEEEEEEEARNGWRCTSTCPVGLHVQGVQREISYFTFDSRYRQQST